MLVLALTSRHHQIDQIKFFSTEAALSRLFYFLDFRASPSFPLPPSSITHNRISCVRVLLIPILHTPRLLQPNFHKLFVFPLANLRIEGEPKKIIDKVLLLRPTTTTPRYKDTLCLVPTLLVCCSLMRAYSE